MLEAFYANLEAKSANDTELKLLRAQWDFDKQLLENALQHVGSLFNHFSRHDSSHSRKILVNIGKLLGGKLNELSATDTWLILEGAFLHDTGMLASYDDLQEIATSSEFAVYVRGVARSSTHELRAFAAGFDEKDPMWPFRQGDNPLAAVNLWHQLLVGWLRSRHATRAQRVAESPETLGITSPHNELLPSRLRRCLGIICRAHTVPFEELLESLPQHADGMSDETCHPRFVACLLRLGDALDMDSGRFCPVMQKLYGPAPRSKAAHEDKHASIIHLRSSGQSIEVEAECATDDGYVAASDWFEMLEKEVGNQFRHWAEIVPQPGFMSVPAVNVRLTHKDADHFLRGGRLPRVSLSEEEVFEVLQGAGIYENKWTALRELLQNAVDATVIRIWLCHKDELVGEENSPISKTFLSLARKYPVEIRIQPEASDKEGWRAAVILIKDQGCGISRSTFEKMLRVGSGGEEQRQEVIDQMPEWMKPSGAFGLGLQSAFFLGASQLEFTTRSLLDNTEAQLTIPSPLGGMRGFAKYKKLPYNPGREYGTELSFRMEWKVEKMKTAYERNIGFLFSWALGPDPLSLSDESKLLPEDSEWAQLLKELAEFSQHSPCCLRWAFGGDAMKEMTVEENPRQHQWYDSQEGIVLSCVFGDEWHRKFDMLYRYQVIGHWGFHWVGGYANIVRGNARALLAIDRDSFRESAQKLIFERVRRALCRYVVSEYDRLDAKEKPFASAFLNPSLNLRFMPHVPDEIQHAWENIPLDKKGRHTLGAALHLQKDVCMIWEKISFLFKFRHAPYTESKFEDELHDKNCETIHLIASKALVLFIYRVFKSNGWRLTIIARRKYYSFYFHHTGNLPPFSKNVLATEIESYIKKATKIIYRGYNTIFTMGRVVLPAWGEYIELGISIPKIGTVHMDDILPSEYNFILPYTIKFINKKWHIFPVNVNSLAHWVRKHSRHQEPPSVERIKELYADVRRYIEEEVMGESDIWKEAFVPEIAPLWEEGKGPKFSDDEE